MKCVACLAGLIVVLAVVGPTTGLAAAAAADPAGSISGKVEDAQGAPVAGAYVGVGDFGDAGGSNLGRFQKQGLYTHTKTDENGRFQLAGLALRDHPLVVTHGEFVRHDQPIRLGPDRPQAEVEVRLEPGAKIEATVVDAGGKSLPREFIIRLEALDGHDFLPPDRNPHLSAFASPAWSQRAQQGTARFTELAPGEYCLDVFNVRSTVTVYHGGVARVRADPGEAKPIRIKPADHRSTVTVEVPSPLDNAPQLRPMLVISRNPGLAVWSDRKFHGLEDHRSGRLMHQSLATCHVSPACRYQVKNLPPGTYSFFVGPAVAMQGARVTVAAGGETTADVLWQVPGPKEISTVGLWRLKRRVRLEAKPYTAGQLCQLLSAATESKPDFQVDPSIRDAKLQPPAGEMPIWDAVERVYLDTGWKVDEQKPSTLVLRPPDLRHTADCSLRGTVLDAKDKPVAGAAVVLCGQAGIPFVQGAKRTLSEAFGVGPAPEDLAYEMTDGQGRFTFTNLRAGQYRLVAQSWPDAESIKGLLEVNGEVVQLHGVAERVEVSRDPSHEVVIRPLGTGTIRLDEKIPNNGTLLTISTEPLRADPILGFVGWGGPFIQNLIGGNRMPKGRTTVSGLPEGKIHIALFANDNVPGFGTAETTVRPGETVDLDVPIVAGWSDGHHEPPERLAPLVEEIRSLLQEDKLSVPQVLEAHGIRLKKGGILHSQQEMGQHLTKEIQLPGGRKTTFADFMAAIAYLDLRRSVERRSQQAKAAKQLREMGPSSPGGTKPADYRQAFFDLYQELGKNYPCFELKGIDWKAVGEEFLPRAGELKTDDEFGLLCLELVARLEDSHAQLMPAAAQLPELEFPRWDPGFACLIDDRGKPVVYHVDRGGPAEEAGVKVGMTVLSVGGEPAEEHLEKLMEQTRKYAGYSSDRYLRYHAAQWLGRQIDQDAKVKLEMQDLEGKTRTFELPATLGVRYLPRRPVQVAKTSDTAGVSWTMLDDDIAYVYVRRIRGDLIEKLDQAVSQLKDARGMIVDVRGNSGGGFDASRAHRNFAPDDTEEPNRPRFQGPIALLIDARCISAGEGWASWFIANKRARVFGEATAGASSRKTIYTLSNGLFKVRYPVKAYRGSLARPIERRGLEPDVPLRQNAKDLAAGRDTALEAAKRYLLETQ